MSYFSRLRPELLEDAAKASSWYEDRAAGLGYEFLRAFYAAVATVVQNPELPRPVYAKFRRILLRRFPYKLYYQIEEPETVVFYLLFHGSRDHHRIIRSELGKRQQPD